MRSVRLTAAWRRATAGVRIATGAAVLAVALLSPAGAAFAASSGSETVERAGTLQTGGQSMWQAGGNGGGPEERTVTLFDQKWNAEASGGKIVHVEFLKTNLGQFGAEGEASTTGEVGMSLKLHGFASGSVGVTYPVTASYTIPRKYAFAAGEEVSIDTSETVDPTAALSTAFPNLTSVALDGIFGINAAASGKLCFFVCTTSKLLKYALPEDYAHALVEGYEYALPENYDGNNPVTGQIFELNKPGTACFDLYVNFALGFGHAPPEYTRCHDNKTGTNSGYLSLPKVKTTSKLEADGSLTAEGEDPYVVVPVSSATWATRLFVGKPILLDFGPAQIPGTEAVLGYETIQQVLTDIEAMRQSFTFKPEVDTTLEWGQSMSYVVKDATGTIVSKGTGDAATFPLGDTLTLDTPAGLGGALTIKPKLSMGRAEISNHTENLNIGDGNLSALSLTLDTPAAEYEGVKVWPGSKVNVGPVYNKAFPLKTTKDTLFKSSWTLGGFNEPALGDLTLTADPPPVPTPITIHPVEGQSYQGTIAKFLDPEPTSGASDYAVTIEWGDGASEEGALTKVQEGEEGTLFAVVAKHTYAEEGEYPVAVTIEDIDSPTLVVTAESTADVTDAPLHATPHQNTTMSSGEGALLWPEPASPQPSQTLATFTDEDLNGTIADYEATVEWGDGSDTTGEIRETSAGSKQWEVRASHAYGPSDLGPHTVTVTVRDAGGSEVIQQVPVIAYEYSEGGDFAIAPSTPGQSVTFWGDRWAIENPIFGVPAYFMGWAASGATPPACGDAWSSNPVGSINPPAHVPSYTAVIETSSASMNLAAIEGQTSAVAIVAVAPGYGPRPAKTGLGTVIAQACP